MRTFFITSLLMACEDAEKETVTETVVEEPQDADMDGFTSEEDCDDLDASVNPGADEMCDGLDNNCDGFVDEGVLTTFYVDSDEDGFGDSEIYLEACEAPERYVENGSDCNDREYSVYPGAEDICDGLDNDCNGTIDDDLSETFYVDADGDGFGDPNQAVEACMVTPGLSPLAQDCNDLNSEINPLVNEECDGLDNNCDGTIDEGVTMTYYRDVDEDGFGDDADTIDACDLPPEYSTQGGDCDDINSAANPFTLEICDGIDNNCDGAIDESGAIGSMTYFSDADGDGFGDDTTLSEGCEVPVDSVLVGGDCDDTSALKSPGLYEVCDGIDNDCDLIVDNNAVNETTYYLDSDGDGYGDPSVMMDSCPPTIGTPMGYVENADDCDDSEPLAYASALEVCDGVDNNCDGTIDELGALGSMTYYTDVDGDGFGDDTTVSEGCEVPVNSVLVGGDCDDTSALKSPGLYEVCDGIDNDCDLIVDNNAVNETTYYLDSDVDGYGDVASSILSCPSTLPAGYVDNSDDCNDAEPLAYSNALELCDTVDNDCDGQVDNNPVDQLMWYLDSDGDGFGDSAQMEIGCEAPVQYVDNADDCVDVDSAINPMASEVCDGIDNDCDGDVDTNAIDVIQQYLDLDEDGFGDLNVTASSCELLVGYIENFDDCDDSDAAIYPNALEICDGVDNDCDGVTTDELLGNGIGCSAASCQEILLSGDSTGDGLYWLDPDQDGDVQDSWEAYCDMTRDGGGWTKMESALFPFLFTTSNWDEFGAAADDNYSMMVEVDEFETSGTFTFRYEVGNSGVWSDFNRAHFTVWTQGHHPAYESTNGSGYQLIDGQESTTCGGFNGFHSFYYESAVNAGNSPYSILNDVDSSDSYGCWWMQAIPLRIYDGGGYLEGYNGTNLHQWQSFWIR